MCVGVGVVCDSVCVCISSYLGLLQGPSQGSVYLEIGGLPKSVYLTARLAHADRVRTSINQAYKGQCTPNGSVSVNDANVIC